MRMSQVQEAHNFCGLVVQYEKRSVYAPTVSLFFFSCKRILGTERSQKPDGVCWFVTRGQKLPLDSNNNGVMQEYAKHVAQRLQ